MPFPFFSHKTAKQREAEILVRHCIENFTYVQPDPTVPSNLKRRKARVGDDRWTHMIRCRLCDHDNMCKEQPGRYPCERIESWSKDKRCPGWFEVSQRDAARMRNMPQEQRVPFESMSDRYDHEMLKERNRYVTLVFFCTSRKR